MSSAWIKYDCVVPVLSCDQWSNSILYILLLIVLLFIRSLVMTVVNHVYDSAMEFFTYEIPCGCCNSTIKKSCIKQISIYLWIYVYLQCKLNF